MKEYMCEDMFTPEGIFMTSPHDCGMCGEQDWKYDTWRMRCEQNNIEEEMPAMAFSSNKCE
jgi:hypothetical protein